MTEKELVNVVCSAGYLVLERLIDADEFATIVTKAMITTETWKTVTGRKGKEENEDSKVS